MLSLLRSGTAAPSQWDSALCRLAAALPGQCEPCRFATKKVAGTVFNNYDSHSKRLGVKIFGDQLALPGNIIIRQRGTQWHPGINVHMGKDHTLHALVRGRVHFTKERLDPPLFGKRWRKFVHVRPEEAPVEKPVQLSRPGAFNAAAAARIESIVESIKAEHLGASKSSTSVAAS